jgi:hypothetical protein
MPEEFDSAGEVDGKSEIREREIEPLHQNRSELQRRVDLEPERSAADREAKRDPEFRFRSGFALSCLLAARLDH